MCGATYAPTGSPYSRTCPLTTNSGTRRGANPRLVEGPPPNRAPVAGIQRPYQNAPICSGQTAEPRLTGPIGDRLYSTLWAGVLL